MKGSQRQYSLCLWFARDMIRDLELHKRIHSRVVYDYEGDGCTLWQGPIKNGSPYIWYKGREQNLRRLVTGEIDRRIILKVYCEQDRCINPAHIVFESAGKTYTVEELRLALDKKRCPKGHLLNNRKRCADCRRAKKKERDAHRI